MTQNRKPLGMTSMQLGILIGLGALVCILFGVIAWVMLGNKIQLPSFSRAPETTPTPQMTATMVVFPTLTPTATQTPIPYEQLIPNGWVQFKTGLIEVWLPPSFKTAKKEADEELLLVGSTSKSSLYKLKTVIIYEPLVGDSLDAFLDSDLAKLDPQVKLTERRKISVNSTEAVRITLEMRVDGVDVNELIYVFQDGSTVWFVGYIAQINEFYDMLPTFEQSAKTFRTVK